ncbi:hypothetical protein DXA21_20760 [Parabacteroides distasonis]|nr:hypothetical protein DXA21_20760 [Parabacteroides distasonis]
MPSLQTFLADNHVDMRAFEIADSSDFGIIRIIVDKPLDTLTLLKDNDWICNLTQVVGVKIPDEPGAMAKTMNILAEAGVSVEYVTHSLQEELTMHLWFVALKTMTKLQPL